MAQSVHKVEFNPPSIAKSFDAKSEKKEEGGKHIKIVIMTC